MSEFRFINVFMSKLLFLAIYLTSSRTN